jgi:crossover junction endodeoxyribonuclease RuvC
MTGKGPVIGIDPGIMITGWAVLHQGQLVGFGEIKPTKSLNMPDKLLYIHSEFMGILAHYKPEIIAVEKVFLHKNPHSALVLAYVRAAILIAGASAKVLIEECAATRAKKAFMGYGHADKAQVQAMVKTCFGLDLSKDSADAAALAFYVSR